MDKREREARRLVRKYGLDLRPSRSGHFVVVDNVGAVVAVTGSSPGKNAMKLLEGDIRRSIRGR